MRPLTPAVAIPGPPGTPGPARRPPAGGQARRTVPAAVSWVLASAALTLAVATVVICAVDGDLFIISLVPGSIGAATMGGLVVARRPGHRMGPLLCAIALADAISEATFGYARAAVVHDPGGLPFGVPAMWATSWDYVLAECLAVPTGRLLPHAVSSGGPRRHAAAHRRPALSTGPGWALSTGPGSGAASMAMAGEISAPGDGAGAHEAAGAAARAAAETDADVLRSALAGQRRAWDTLVERYDAQLHRFAGSFGLDRATRDDVVQATWLSLFEHADTLREPGRVRAWLMTTLRRHVLAVFRARGRGPGLAMIDVVELPCPGRSPEQEVTLGDRDRRLRVALRRLPDRDRRLLALLMGSPSPSYEEVSAELRMPVGSIGPTRARSLGRLRRELEVAGVDGDLVTV